MAEISVVNCYIVTSHCTRFILSVLLLALHPINQTLTKHFLLLSPTRNSMYRHMFTLLRPTRLSLTCRTFTTSSSPRSHLDDEGFQGGLAPDSLLTFTRLYRMPALTVPACSGKRHKRWCGWIESTSTPALSSEGVATWRSERYRLYIRRLGYPAMPLFEFGTAP